MVTIEDKKYKINDEEYDYYYKLYGDKYIEELKKERKFKDEARDHLERTMNKAKAEGKATETATGQNMVSWHFKKLSNYYQLFIDKNAKPKSGIIRPWALCLREMFATVEDREALSDLFAFSVLSVVVNTLAMNPNGLQVDNTALTIKDILEAEYEYQEFAKFLKDKEHKTERAGFEKGIRKRISPYYRRHYMNVAMHRDGFIPKGLEHKDGLKALAVQLLYIAAEVLNYFDIVPYGKKGMNIIVPTQEYVEGWKRNDRHILDNAFKMIPTIIPPKPWTNYHDGGYYGDLSPVNNLLRLTYSRGGSFYNKYILRLEQTDLTEVMKAVNGIQATPWVINKQVLDVIDVIIDRGGNMAGIPHIAEDPKPMELPENPTEEQLKQYKSVMPDWYRSETKRKSKALRAISTLHIAHEFAEYDKIYFPCNLDFRGRIYPIPTFNFQGDDLNKSLILFADPPACDCLEDIDWLAITGCNISGRDKISFADRIAWVKRHESDILLSAEKPLEYTWWMTNVETTDESTETEKAYADENNIDEPCQMLAFCFEWARWKQWEKEHNGDPKGFVTGLPSHQDGTCSGLQHFSAILRDPVGGTAVNLVPQGKPNDIYKLVAEEAKKQLLVDAQNGSSDEYDKDGKLHYGDKTMAQVWLSYPKYGRKVTKRPTMTLAYGAKEYGYRDQILTDTIEPAMEDAEKKHRGCVFTKENKWRASSYMAKVIWNSVDKVVVKAVEGMAWLQQCARDVCKKGVPVTWVTPLGLPVQQEYLQTDYKVVQMTVMGKRIRVYSPIITGDINKVQQTNGIAPNFIHSMDACHLMLTVNYCLDAGIVHYSTIHDSYGCPISQTKLMYKLVRKAFYDMYTQYDVLENFRQDMERITGENTIQLPPSKDGLDLSVVLDSPYIFC